jgi:hypothetical protein
VEPIHLLSIFTLVMLPLAVWKAHTHQVAGHRRAMIVIFSGALIIRGPVHIGARADHAQGAVWRLKRPPETSGFWPSAATSGEPITSAVSDWKNERKNLCFSASKGGF